MDRVRVSSSNLRSVGYDPIESILEVEFRTGAIYRYFNVPDHKFGGLLAAGSKGRYLHNHIKGRYRYRRVR